MDRDFIKEIESLEKSIKHEIEFRKGFAKTLEKWIVKNKERLEKLEALI